MSSKKLRNQKKKHLLTYDQHIQIILSLKTQLDKELKDVLILTEALKKTIDDLANEYDFIDVTDI